MFRNILSVGGFTLLSRLAGFIRDVVMAAVLGAGPVADAFLVAFRLPNHFRAIFAEGAFNAAFIPTYARLKEQNGLPTAKGFADQVFTAMLLAHGVLLAIALGFTPWFVGLLAPGLSDDPFRFDLAVTLTRVTFPYLALISIVTLMSGALNACGRFAIPAAAPILLNISMIGALSAAFLFPNAGHAAAWGVLVAGILQVLFVAVDAERNGIGIRLRIPRLDPGTTRFLKALGPAIIGAAGAQIAAFADTIIASFLPSGALSALYYADRIYQLPIGVVGIAIGTVLLPDMSRRIAGGDEAGAAHSQARAVELAVLLSIPFAAAVLLVPDLIMQALFARGAFSTADAAAAADTLQAYGLGLLAVVLIRAFIAPFHSRSDTRTPMIASLVALAFNVMLKLVLVGHLSQVGLAFATAVGVWLNLALLIFFARRFGYPIGDAALGRNLLKLGAVLLVVAGALHGVEQGARHLLPASLSGREEVIFLLVVAGGGIVYICAVLAILGRSFLAGVMGRKRASPVS
ncbi:murein biosynthesis integral membrane protein MurJ [Xanthobacter sp. TB0136]|uniref:murein biosynthesis integral membrane protein MurJ n=1 Tax=Xanthobacter sp. TB0136 TaxID=3459177 RepID=UPI0040391A83